MTNKKFSAGFTVTGSEPFMTEDWLYSKEFSTPKLLVFEGYDANMCPMLDFSTRPETEWKQKVIDTALEFTKQFSGEVWLDDYQVK